MTSRGFHALGRFIKIISDSSVQVVLARPANEFIAAAGLDDLSHCPPILNKGRSNLAIGHFIVDFVSHGPDLISANNGGANQLSSPILMPPTHRGENTQVRTLA